MVFGWSNLFKRSFWGNLFSGSDKTGFNGGRRKALPRRKQVRNKRMDEGNANTSATLSNPAESYHAAAKLIKSIWNKRNTVVYINNDKKPKRLRKPVVVYLSPNRASPRQKKHTSKRVAKTSQGNRLKTVFSLGKSRKKPKTTRKKKYEYPTSTKDFKNIKVKKIRRYNSGNSERQYPQVQPTGSPSMERMKLLRNNRHAMVDRFEKSQDNILEDPLNVKRIHNSYIRRIGTTPPTTSAKNASRFPQSKTIARPKVKGLGFRNKNRKYKRLL